MRSESASIRGVDGGGFCSSRRTISELIYGELDICILPVSHDNICINAAWLRRRVSRISTFHHNGWNLSSFHASSRELSPFPSQPRRNKPLDPSPCHHNRSPMSILSTSNVPLTSTTKAKNIACVGSEIGENHLIYRHFRRSMVQPLRISLMALR